MLASGFPRVVGCRWTPGGAPEPPVNLLPPLDQLNHLHTKGSGRVRPGAQTGGSETSGARRCPQLNAAARGRLENPWGPLFALGPSASCCHSFRNVF